MGQSLSNILVHLVFSTNERAPLIEEVWRHELHNMIVAIIRRLGGEVIIVNSVKDHVHLFLPLPRTVTVSNIMREVKSETSKWIHEKLPQCRTFQWQGGYGAFSVSPTHRAAVVGYIKSQEEHHRTVTFKDEFVRLLQKYDL